MIKLKAIMFSDIIGYTVLSENDRDMALQIQKSNLELHQKLISEHYGELANDMGDGVLACFDSAKDAVECAIELQSNLKGAGYGIRIGIDLGDVDTNDRNLIGPVTNCASRIQELGGKLSVLMSSRVRDQVVSRTDLQLISLGPRNLKNIAEPQEVFAITSGGLVIPNLSNDSLPVGLQPLSNTAKTVLSFLDEPAVQMVGGANYTLLLARVPNMGLLNKAIKELQDHGFAQIRNNLIYITPKGTDYLHS